MGEATIRKRINWSSLILACILMICSAFALSDIHVCAESTSNMQIPDEAEYWCGHWYKVYDEALTPAEAKAKCESMGGYLATATTAKEYDQIWGMIESKSKAKKAYTIMDIHKGEDGWDWDTGEELCYTKWQSFASSWKGDVYFYYNAGLCLGWSDEALVEAKELGQWNQYGTYSQIPTGTTKTNHHVAILNGHLSFSMYATCSSYYIPGEGDAYHSLGGKGGMVEFNEDDVKNGYICEWGDPVTFKSENVLLNGQQYGKKEIVKYVFDGTSKKPSSIKVYYDGIELSLNQDYVTEVLGRSAIGVAKAIVTGINRYQGTVVEYYYVVPKQANKPSLAVDTGTNNITITWDEVEKAQGYDVRWATSQEELEGAVTHEADDKREYSMTHLKTGKTYYVQVRAVGDRSNPEVAGAWSNVASVYLEKNLSLDYLEVGIGGNVTVHWITPEKLTGITGYEIQHRIKGTTDPMTTTVNGVNNTSRIIENLSYNDYEFRIRSFNSTTQSEWTEWAECPVKEIKITNPKIGDNYVDPFSFYGVIDFGVNGFYIRGEGLSIYNDNKKILSLPYNTTAPGEEDADYSSGNVTIKKENFFSSDQEDSNGNKIASNPKSIFAPGENYHVSIPAKAIEYADSAGEPFTVPVYFSGIPVSDKDSWYFSTADISTPGLLNPSGITIDNKYYELLYKEQDCDDIKEIEDGSKGHCFGLCYTVGAFKEQYNCISKVASNYDNLNSIPINEGSKLLEYVQIAHIYQGRPEYAQNNAKEITDINEMYTKLVSGKPVCISITMEIKEKDEDGKTVTKTLNHKIIGFRIIDDTNPNSLKIAVYDSNAKSVDNDKRYFLQTAILEKNKSSWNFIYEEQRYGKSWEFKNFFEIGPDIDSACEKVMRGENIGDYPYKLVTTTKPFSETKDKIWKFSPTSGNNTNEIYGYWFEGNSFYFEGTNEPTTLTISDGTNKIYASLAAGQSATLDIENNRVTVDGTKSGGSAGEYTVRFSKAEDYDTFHDIVLQGTSGEKDTILTRTEEGIGVSSDSGSTIIVSTEENNTEVEKTTAVITSENADIKIGESGHITVPEIPLKEVGISGIKPEYRHTGKAITPVPVLTFKNKSLEINKDFTVSYDNNINLGTATITITGIGNYTESVKVSFKIVKPEVSKELNNPVIEQDASMVAKQKVTWDCIWFGKYPQTEIVDKPESSGAFNKVWEKDSDYIVDADLYEKLSSATEWDDRGDTVIEGTKYRRINVNDTTWSRSSSTDYNWTNDNGYHYFRYEEIKWRVLNVTEDKALLLSDISIDDQQYNTTYNVITWETCTLRSWLNGYGSSSNTNRLDCTQKNFIDAAFTDSEQSLIIPSMIDNKTSGKYTSFYGGENTTDKIFLLAAYDIYNTKEAVSYGFVVDSGVHDEARQAMSSTYAKAMGISVGNVLDPKTYIDRSGWLLRSPTGANRGQCCADAQCSGYVGETVGGNVDYRFIGIRPAMLIDFSTSDVWDYAGTVCSDGTVNEVRISKSDKKAASDFIALIDSLGDPLGPDDIEAVNQAKLAFEHLTEYQMELVPVEIKEKLDNAVKVTQVLELITKVDANDQASVEAARKAYDSLPAGLKNLVSADVIQSLVKAEETIRQKNATKPATKKKFDNPLKVKGKTATVKYKKVKKKAVILKRAKALTVSKAKGKVRFKLLNVKKPKFKKYFKVYSATGNIKVKKKLKKGIYKLVIRVTAAGDGNYKARTRNVSVKVRVK